MLASKKTRRGVIGAVVLAGVLAVSGYALTNAATVTDVSNAADGTGTIATVTVDDDSIDYTVNATDPNLADSVTFNVQSSGKINATTEGWLKLVDGAPTGGSTQDEWMDCTTPGGAAATPVAFTCVLTVAGGSTTPVEFIDIDTFRVVIAD